MTWKRVRRVGAGEGAVELEPTSGAVIGPSRSWFLVPEDGASECCWQMSEKPTAEPDDDPYQGLLIVPAEHVEQSHPEHAE